MSPVQMGQMCEGRVFRHCVKLMVYDEWTCDDQPSRTTSKAMLGRGQWNLLSTALFPLAFALSSTAKDENPQSIVRS